MCVGCLCTGKVWNIFCDDKYELSESEHRQRYERLGAEILHEFRAWYAAFDELAIETGNPIDHMIDYRRDEKNWLESRGSLALCAEECTPRGAPQCVSTMLRVYARRNQFLDRASLAETAAVDRFGLVSNMTDTQSLLGVLNEVARYREKERKFMANLRQRQRPSWRFDL